MVRTVFDSARNQQSSNQCQECPNSSSANYRRRWRNPDYYSHYYFGSWFFTRRYVIQIDGTTNFNARAIVLTTPSTTTFTYDLGSVGSATPDAGTAKTGSIFTGDGSDIVLDGTLDLFNAPVITLIFDLTIVGNGGWRVVSGLGGGVAVPDTPWTVDHDANDFLLSNLLRVDFSNTVGAGTPLKDNVHHNVLNVRLVLQARPDTGIYLMVGDTIPDDIVAEIERQDSIDFNEFDFDRSVDSIFRMHDLVVSGRSNFIEDMTLVITNPTGANPNLSLSQLVADTGTGGNLGTGAAPWNDLNIEQIAFREGDEIIDIASMAFRANKLRINVDDGDTIDLLFGGTLRYEWNETVFKPIFDDNVDLGTITEQFRDLHLDGIANIDTLNFGEPANQSTMFGFLTIAERVTPADPFSAASVNLFLDDSTGELSVRKFGSTTVSLETGGVGGGGDGLTFASVVKSTGECCRGWRSEN